MTAVISVAPAGRLSLMRTAASTAWRSSGLSSASTPSLIIVPVFSSIFTVSTAGTCLISTAIFNRLPPDGNVYPFLNKNILNFYHKYENFTIEIFADRPKLADFELQLKRLRFLLNFRVGYGEELLPL